MAQVMNSRAQDIGARRLHTVVEKVLEDLSFHATEASVRKIDIDADYVRERLSKILEDEDLSRYIL